MSKYLQSINSDGNSQFNFPNGSIMTVPTLSDVDQNSEPCVHVLGAADALQTFMTDVAAIANDASLSTLGVANQIAPLATIAICQLALSYAAVASYEAALDKRYSDLIAVPVLLPGDMVNATTDLEIRNYWATLDRQQQIELAAKMDQGPELQRFELALLRSPVPSIANDMLAMVRASWEKGCRANDVAADVAIETGRQLVEWSYRGLAQLAAALLATLPRNDYPRDRVLRVLLSDSRKQVQDAYPLFGFDDRTVATMRLQLAALKGSTDSRRQYVANAI
jgi:hypothetical protein